MDKINPYESPQAAAERVSMSSALNRWATPLRLSFSLVFIFNQALPLFIGWHVTASGGRIGMFVAVGVLFALGLCVCELVSRIGWALVVGGGLVGAGQFIPVAQLIAGAIGLGVGEAFGQARPAWPDGIAGKTYSEIGGFIVAFTTGALLMIAAACVGGILQWMFGRSQRTPKTV
jgi:hypothetical protein